MLGILSFKKLAKLNLMHTFLAYTKLKRNLNFAMLFR